MIAWHSAMRDNHWFHKFCVVISDSLPLKSNTFVGSAAVFKVTPFGSSPKLFFLETIRSEIGIILGIPSSRTPHFGL